jgi:hypothetical protein
MKVPDVLLSRPSRTDRGVAHGKMLGKTKRNRPDLLKSRTNYMRRGIKMEEIKMVEAGQLKENAENFNIATRSRSISRLLRDRRNGFRYMKDFV